MSLFVLDVQICDKGNLEDSEVKQVNLDFLSYKNTSYKSLDEFIKSLKQIFRLRLYYVDEKVTFYLVGRSIDWSELLYEVWAYSSDGTGEDFGFNFKILIVNENNVTRFLKCLK